MSSDDWGPDDYGASAAIQRDILKETVSEIAVLKQLLTEAVEADPSHNVMGEMWHERVRRLV